MLSFIEHTVVIFSNTKKILKYIIKGIKYFVIM